MKYVVIQFYIYIDIYIFIVIDLLIADTVVIVVGSVSPVLLGGLVVVSQYYRTCAICTA